MQFPTQKISKKGVQNGPIFEQGTGTQKGHSALLECRLAQTRAMAQVHLDLDKTHRFQFFRDKDAFQFVF